MDCLNSILKIIKFKVIISPQLMFSQEDKIEVCKKNMTMVFGNFL